MIRPIADLRDEAVCALCERRVPRRLITLHHLLPKQKGGKAVDRVPLCRPCHSQIHATFHNRELAKSFTTIDALRRSERLTTFLGWIRKQKPGRTFRVCPAASRPGRWK